MKNSKSYDIQFIKLNVRIWIVVRCDNEVNIVLKYDKEKQNQRKFTW